MLALAMPEVLIVARLPLASVVTTSDRPALRGKACRRRDAGQRVSIRRRSKRDLIGARDGRSLPDRGRVVEVGGRPEAERGRSGCVRLRSPGLIAVLLICPAASVPACELVPIATLPSLVRRFVELPPAAAWKPTATLPTTAKSVDLA